MYRRSSLSTPTGPIQNVSGLDWSAITRYDDFIHEAADPVGWPIERVRGHIIIESRGNPRAVQRNPSNGDSYGLLQVVPYGVSWDGWHDLIIDIAELPRGASRQRVINALYDPRINIAVGVAILESFYVQHGTLDKASSAFFTGRPDWGGTDTVNGTRGIEYRNLLMALIAEQQAFNPIDPIAVIMGGPSYNNFFGFNVKTTLPYYSYGAGHGLDGRSHTGYDIATTIGQPLYTPGAGVVTCAGTNVGPGSWRTGCAAFPDYFGKGAGRVEILLDAGPSVILGHCSESTVRSGQRVKAGDQVATAGGMNSPHVHLEVREWRGGDYVIVDPYQSLTRALANQPAPQPPAVVYPERIPVAQPEEFDNSVRVVATKDGVPVLQGAYAGAAEVGPPLTKGEDFQAVYQMVGVDKRLYWVSTRRARVPVEGTASPEWDALVGRQPVSKPEEGGISQATLDELVDTLELIRAGVAKQENALRGVIAVVGALEGDTSA